MLIERKSLWAKAEAFVHLQGRHPLRDVFVNGKRQTEEIIHLFFVVEFELSDVHDVVGAQYIVPLHDFRAFCHLSTQTIDVVVNRKECAEI